jgi:hypothetical protein
MLSAANRERTVRLGRDVRRPSRRMQRLGSACLLGLVSSAVQAYTSAVDTVTLQAACTARSPSTQRATLPWQTRTQTLQVYEGHYTLSLVLSTRKPPVDEHSDPQLDACAQQAYRQVSDQHRSVSDSVLEDLLPSAVNQCLAARRSTQSVRFVTIQRGRIECAR